jgi:acetyl/propionyl-CoA carboxylase alpha subunit
VAVDGGAARAAPMRFWALLGEGARRHELDLDVQLDGDRLVLDTGTERISADVAPLPDGESYSLLVDGRSYEVAVEEDGATLRVRLGGRTFRASVRSPLERVLREVGAKRESGAASVLFAPMPGLIVALKTAPGEAVAAGQAILVMEAMKMQNELSAEADGVVEAVHVAVGQSVEAGQALLTLGPPAGAAAGGPAEGGA